MGVYHIGTKGASKIVVGEVHTYIFKSGQKLEICIYIYTVNPYREVNCTYAYVKCEVRSTHS